MQNIVKAIIEDDQEYVSSYEGNMNETTINGITLLMIAASWGRESIVNHLIRNGAIITRRNDNNYQAIDIARQHRHFNIVKILENGIVS